MQGVQETEKPLTGGKRVLVVDDDRPSREGLRATLVRGGFSVETAADSLQALRKLWEGQFAVAIIDVDLPAVYGVTMSGWDLVRIFQGFDPAIAIIVVSAEGGPEARAQAERLKVAEFLEKPVSPTYLKTLVKRLDP